MEKNAVNNVFNNLIITRIRISMQLLLFFFLKLPSDALFLNKLIFL